LTGIQGEIGTQGTVGSQGTQGTIGTQGSTGTQGAEGLQGLTGNQGITGNQGTTGNTGNNGAQGTQGIQGNQGTQGILGTSGIVVSSTPPVSTNVLWEDTTASANDALATINVTSPIVNTGTTINANVGLDTTIIPTGNVISQHENAPANAIETMNKVSVVTSSSNTSGRVWLTMFTPLFNQTITNLVIPTAGVTSPSYTLAKLGLFTVSGTSVTLVAETASDTILMATANTFYTRALSSARSYPTSYTLLAGTRYALGAITVGTGSANIWTNNQLSQSILSFTSPYAAGLITGMSDLPTIATTFTAINQSFFARCS